MTITVNGRGYADDAPVDHEYHLRDVTLNLVADGEAIPDGEGGTDHWKVSRFHLDALCKLAGLGDVHGAMLELQRESYRVEQREAAQLAALDDDPDMKPWRHQEDGF